MSHSKALCLVLIGLAVLAESACRPGWASVAYVVEPGTPGVNPGEPYNTWTNASTNIATAVDYIAAAGEPDNTVWVDAGTYFLDAQVTVNHQVAIRGTNGQPVVDGGGAVRCFYFSAGITGSLENLYITGGYAGPSDPDGGGVYIHNGELRNCVLADNEAATNGGGLFFNRANLSASDSTNLVYGCTIVSNRAVNGGGAYFIGSNAEHFAVAECVFQTNIATGDGGGMHTFNQGDTLRPILIDDCDLTENWAGDQGGGAYTRCAVFNACRISGNYAHVYGGGAGAQYGSYNIFSNCMVSGNYCREYGGGLVLYSIGEINGCVIVSNTCPGTGGGNRGGGGVYMSRLNSVIKNSKLMHNTSNRGGGIMMLGGQVWNSLIVNNSAALSDFRGGGIHCVDVAAYDSYIYNCTIASNYANSQYGGGVYSLNTTRSHFFENTIIYGNSNATPDSATRNYYLAESDKITFTNCCLAPALSGAPATYSVNNITSDPVFAAPGSDNYRLHPYSPCINEGFNRDWMTNAVDLDGAPRILYDIVDIGCYERLLPNAGTIFSVR